MKILRFAPSPTGYLHIGGARTALFNYLYSKRHKGRLILRIEDTDKERSSDEMSGEIIDALSWLGIKWDKGPYYQSERFEVYKTYAFKLLKEKKAYRCFCTKEELEKRRIDSHSKSYKYDRRCFYLSTEEINRNLEQNKPFVIRFKIEEGFTEFKDGIHKKLSINNKELEDFVILKSDGTPTYHLSVVVDDSEMEITDIIRGNDHISNTFKQILLFKALGKKPPKYFHLPLILGQDRKKLSKRHGETSVLEFKRRGYLASAMITYLAQLSWNPGDYKKIFTMNELIEKFDILKVSKNSPVFDYKKLDFLNSKAISQESSEKILNILERENILDKKYKSIKINKKLDLITLIKTRSKNLIDIKQMFDVYLANEFNYDTNDINDLEINKDILKILKIFTNELKEINLFNAENIENKLRQIAEKNKIKAAILIHLSRYALLGTRVSPSIFEVFEFLGKETSIKRLSNFIKFTKENVFTD